MVPNCLFLTLKYCDCFIFEILFPFSHIFFEQRQEGNPLGKSLSFSLRWPFTCQTKPWNWDMTWLRLQGCTLKEQKLFFGETGVYVLFGLISSHTNYILFNLHLFFFLLKKNLNFKNFCAHFCKRLNIL